MVAPRRDAAGADAGGDRAVRRLTFGAGTDRRRPRRIAGAQGRAVPPNAAPAGQSRHYFCVCRHLGQARRQRGGGFGARTHAVVQPEPAAGAARARRAVFPHGLLRAVAHLFRTRPRRQPAGRGQDRASRPILPRSIAVERASAAQRVLLLRGAIPVGRQSRTGLAVGAFADRRRAAQQPVRQESRT